MASTWVEEPGLGFSDGENSLSERQFAGMAGLTLGRRFDWFEPYLGYRAIFIAYQQDSLSSLFSWVHNVKVGARFNIGEHFFLGVEGGVTVHTVIPVAEGAMNLGFRFGG